MLIGFSPSPSPLPVVGGLAGAATRTLFPLVTIRRIITRPALRNALWLIEDIVVCRAAFEEASR